MANGDIYQLTRKVLVDGNAHFNVLHFRQDNSEDPAEQALADHWNGILANPGPESKFLNAMEGYETYVPIGLSIQRIFPTQGDAQDFPLLAAVPDQSAGLPTFAAVVHQVKTGFGSRSKRGKFYVGAIPEGFTTGNVLTGPGLAVHQEIDSDIMDFFNLTGANWTGFTFGVWSRLLQEFTSATSISTTSVVATLRRRKAGRGI